MDSGGLPGELLSSIALAILIRKNNNRPVCSCTKHSCEAQAWWSSTGRMLSILPVSFPISHTSAFVHFCPLSALQLTHQSTLLLAVGRCGGRIPKSSCLRYTLVHPPPPPPTSTTPAYLSCALCGHSRAGPRRLSVAARQLITARAQRNDSASSRMRLQVEKNRVLVDACHLNTALPLALLRFVNSPLTDK